MDPISNIGLIIEGSAVVVSALSAMITAAKKRLDFVGVYALAVVTSFSGGTLRDLLLDRRPFFWVDRWEYLVIVLALCVPFVYSSRLYRWSSTFVERANVIPQLFQHGRLHAASALVGAVAYLLLRAAGLREGIVVAAAVAITVALRLVALWGGAALPRPHWLRTGRWRTP